MLSVCVNNRIDLRHVFDEVCGHASSVWMITE
jgi:hypothetical protein